jgi:hypothetical protein
LGVVGGINAKVDLALLADVATRRPDWRIELVGPLSYGLDADELARLRALPNVHVSGAVPPEQVPAVMAGCDVGLIPYKLNEQTRHVNPLKVYEYLAAGRPVVGTPRCRSCASSSRWCGWLGMWMGLWRLWRRRWPRGMRPMPWRRGWRWRRPIRGRRGWSGWWRWWRRLWGGGEWLIGEW